MQCKLTLLSVVNVPPHCWHHSSHASWENPHLRHPLISSSKSHTIWRIHLPKSHSNCSGIGPCVDLNGQFLWHFPLQWQWKQIPWLPQLIQDSANLLMQKPKAAFGTFQFPCWGQCGPNVFVLVDLIGLCCLCQELFVVGNQTVPVAEAGPIVVGLPVVMI